MEGRLELGGRVGYELKRVQHALRQAMDEALRETGVTTPQYAAMSVLAEEPGLSNARLARRSFVTPQTMNQILARLEASGLVERRGHPEHGRVLQNFLTREGEGLLEGCDRSVDAVEERMVSGLNGGRSPGAPGIAACLCGGPGAQLLGLEDGRCSCQVP